MTHPIIKLVHGRQSINLVEAGKYFVSNSFVPPVTKTTPVLATGTVGRTYGGSQLISKRASDTLAEMTVLCLGTSTSGSKARARKLQAFVTQYAGDQSIPLQLHYRENSDVAAEPLWGEHGANLRYTIIHANVDLDSRFTVLGSGKRATKVHISLVIRPYSDGLKMRLGTATGGILEDTIGTVDGRSRGLIIPEATTNKMTNPVFGNATYDTWWTAQPTVEENTDAEFVLFGTSSAKITVVNSANRSFYQSINAGNTNAHVLTCYVKKADGSAATSSDCTLRYGATLSTDSYTAVGNGWYRMQLAVTGIASAQVTGIAMAATVGAAVYADGFQFEERAYATPLAYGDMLGCAWTGTAHASTSTRTAASYRLPVASALNFGMGTIRVAWKAPMANTGYSGATGEFFRSDVVNFIGRFNGTDNKFYFLDGTNTISSAATTFSAGDTIVLHFVFKRGSLKIYRAGVEIATGSTYTPPIGITNIYIGSSNTATLHSGGTFLDFATYDTAMTATEILNDYTNIAAIVADGERVGCIPWLWTKDGDDTVDNCDDSTRDDWAMVGGIPGSVPAETEFVLDPANPTYENAIWLGLNVKEYGDHVPQANQYYIEASGTADANASGGEYSSKALPAAPYPSISLATITKPETLTGRLNWFVRFKAASGTPSISMYPIAIVNGVNIYNSTAVVKTASTSYEIYYLGKLDIDLTEFDAADLAISFQIMFNGSATLHVDFAQIIDGPLIKIQPTFFDTPDGAAAASYFDEVTLNGQRAKADSSNYQPILTGDVIELVPERLNRLYILMGDDSGVHLITNTLTFNSIDITPRYALL